MMLTFPMILRLFEEHLKNKGYAVTTIKKACREAGYCVQWLHTHGGKTDAREVTAEDIVAYQCSLTNRGPGRKELAASSRASMLGAVKLMFTFLAKNEYVLTNPCDGLSLGVKRDTHLRSSIAERSVQQFLDSIDGTGSRDLRDRALFELLYGTGLRVGEASRLAMTDVDLATGTLLVRQGKGNRDRIVPLGDTLVRVLSGYLEHGRPELLRRVTESSVREAFFLTEHGTRMSLDVIEKTLKKRFREAGLDETNVCPHMLRHSFATHLLDHGAGIKPVKEILGHQHLETTVGYTHFSVQSLRRIMKRYHPRENELYEELTEAERQKLRALLTSA